MLRILPSRFAQNQIDPFYCEEAFNLFDQLISRLREHVTAQLMRIEVVLEQPSAPQLPEMRAHHVDASTGVDELALADIAAGDPFRAAATALGFSASPVAAEADAPNTIDPADPSTWGKVGRNDACPCGSGKKFKHCHGRFA